MALNRLVQASRLFHGSRSFCVISQDRLPAGLRESSQVVLRLHQASEQLKANKDGAGVVKAVGVSDRGAGLVYRAGRPGATSVIESKEAKDQKQGVWIVKIQPPLDVSSDSAGGIGRITPATLLLNDKKWDFVRFVKEDDEGHFPLLRCALSEANQVAYRYAEEYNDKGPMLRVYTSVQPEQEITGW